MYLDFLIVLRDLAKKTGVPQEKEREKKSKSVDANDLCSRRVLKKNNESQNAIKVI